MPEQMCLEAIALNPSYGEAYIQLGDVYKDSEQVRDWPSSQKFEDLNLSDATVIAALPWHSVCV